MKQALWTRAVVGLAIVVGLAAPAGADRPAQPAPARTADGLKPAEGGRWTAPVKVTGKIDGKTMAATMLVYLPRGYPSGKPAKPDSATKPDPFAAAKPGPVAAATKYPLVIALHGWNHSPEMMRDKSQLARWADVYGVVLAVPTMRTTVYETALYPESKRTWGAVPGTRWVGEIILPYVRASYAVHADRAHTAVIGYSTGGRGAVLLAETYPEFAFAGSASGTFDLMRLAPADGEYKIHAVVYGPRDKFAARWELDNCTSPARLAQLAGTQLFIAHGAKDKSVRPDQLDALRDAVKGNASVQAEFVVAPDGAHTWEYWNSQWGAMFAALGSALGLPAAP